MEGEGGWGVLDLYQLFGTCAPTKNRSLWITGLKGEGNRKKGKNEAAC